MRFFFCLHCSPFLIDPPPVADPPFSASPALFILVGNVDGERTLSDWIDRQRMGPFFFVRTRREKGFTWSINFIFILFDNVRWVLLNGWMDRGIDWWAIDMFVFMYDWGEREKGKAKRAIVFLFW